MHQRTLWLLPLAFFLVSFASPAHAQFWKKKHYQDWSAKDCRKILTNSPWAKDWTFSTVQMPNGMSDTQGAAAPIGGTVAPTGPLTAPNAPSVPSVTPGRQSMTEIKYIAQFFSALPVREAQVRLDQIESHYNKMTPAQKKAFDARAARFLSTPFPKYVVIRVSYSTNVSYWQQTLRTLWRFETAAKLQQVVYLIVDGKVVRLARYQPGPQNEQAFYLFFPRQLENEPILNHTKKSITLQVTESDIHFSNAPAPQGDVKPTRPPAGNVQMEFKVKKMMFQGKIAY